MDTDADADVHVRFVDVFGEKPNFVDCNDVVIVVSHPGSHLVSVLAWHDGALLARFGGAGSGAGQLQCPCALALLPERDSDGSGVRIAVPDYNNHRLCVFR